MAHPTKKQCIKIVQKYAPILHKILGIKVPIEIVIGSTKDSKFIKKHKLTSKELDISAFYQKRKYKNKYYHSIYIYNNQQISLQDTLGTLIHEYIHALLNQIHIRKGLSFYQEEQLVRKLEKIYCKFNRGVII